MEHGMPQEIHSFYQIWWGSILIPCDTTVRLHIPEPYGRYLTAFTGMGNRFRQLPGYHSIVRAHGVIAAITFLFVVPSAILFARFYTRNPRLGLRIHIWLQIITVLLTTVIFTLGTFAVGPTRRLSNPHHGIGTAIFVLVLIQFLFGWWMHRSLKRRKAAYEPLKATVSCVS